MEILNYLIPPAQAYSEEGCFGRHMFSGYDFMGMGGGFMGGIFMVLFWVLAIAGVAYLVKYFALTQNNKKQDKTPLDILKERYAKGEINKDEFEKKKKDLS